jgi:two-component system, NtrC family, sensor histidine kinase HydH
MTLPRIAEPTPDTAGARAESTLATRLAWVTGLRLLTLLALFTATSAFYLGGTLKNYDESQRILLWTFAIGFALAALYGLALRRRRHLTVLAWVQLALDQLTWTSFVYISGGPTSGATSFYALSALVGAILIGQRGAVTAAAFGLSCYLSVCFALSARWIMPPSDQVADGYATTATAMAYPVLLNGLGIAVVAVLSGYLAERLRTTGGRLIVAEERAASAEHLATLGRVAAGLAHEIRNPLGSIRGSIELLRDSPAMNAEDRTLCDIVQRETSRLEDLVNDMMDLARPRMPSPAAVSIARLAKDVVALAMTNSRSGSGDVHVVYGGPDDGANALCDSAQMRQVLWNLVRNAVQVSQAGAQVCVEVRDEPDAIFLIVRDQGPGVDDEAKKRIFDAFYTTRTQGAGLGLAVVKRILDDHVPFGVTLEIESPVTAPRLPRPEPTRRSVRFLAELARAEPGSERSSSTAQDVSVGPRKPSWRPPPPETFGTEFRLRLQSAGYLPRPSDRT